jgi:hypothetical protein
VIYILFSIIVMLVGLLFYNSSVANKEANKADRALHKALEITQMNETLWNMERQQLLDRIQSPTFSEYKHQEVKVIKAKNGTDKPDIVIEQL